MISSEQIIKEYKEGKFIRQISHDHHASIIRIRKVLDQAGLRGGKPI